MKKYFAMMALGLAVAGTSYAQTTPQRGQKSENRTEYGRKDRGDFRRGGEKQEKLTPEQWATKRTEVLSKKLDLNSSKTRKLQELNLKHAQQRESLRGQLTQSGDRSQKQQQRQQMQQLQASWDQEFKSIVSSKEYAKYQEERKQMQANRGDRHEKEGGKNGRLKKVRNS
ncbi:hypothetical protein ACD591_18010 [Rufibacter glacialis]|uniref:DUF4890 domain-containing protein n=1 Tax=Rufibacter glacialis TaxID=1259555 RepID=A0A5M8Q4G9_9BACT|nr:hypothetical protein [Rufibacter glacialis]KAA6430739.1 hypothetical protein FOE74_19930 [Rufibacter glacialis]GGK86352.1 hypothetical protein GCM10011405_37610 [Rufibacter glacialis]